MSDNTADKIIASIDSFVSAQAPQATEVIFSYKSSTIPNQPYDVKVVAVYDNLGSEPIAHRQDLHSQGVSKMEDYLGTTLPLILASPHVLNFAVGNGEGKFGVALKNSSDRADHRVAIDPAELAQPTYSEEL